MANNDDRLSLVKEEDLSLVAHNVLNKDQLNRILMRTPAQYIKKRPAKGGGEWLTVTGGYVKKCLNIMFGWDWDFEIKKQYEAHGQIITEGRLTCRAGDRKLVKEQIGRKDIAYLNENISDGKGGTIKKKTSMPMDYGNDCKASATDALKKCASELGIASDIYNKDEFKAAKIAENEEFGEKESRPQTDTQTSAAGDSGDYPL